MHFRQYPFEHSEVLKVLRFVLKKKKKNHWNYPVLGTQAEWRNAHFYQLNYTIEEALFIFF